VQRAVQDLLGRLDRAAPGRVEGFYVVGSACVGAFRVGRSDIDFVAIVNGGLSGAELARIRAVHLTRWISSLSDAAFRLRWPLVCNGCYLESGDLRRSPLEVTPLAGTTAGRFRIARREGFDVNPVTWQLLARHGVAVRGPYRDRLQIRLDDHELRTWTLANLNGYWRLWADRARHRRLSTPRTLPRRFAAWGVLGAPRLHYTIATGAIASKEAAAHYALETFDSSWQPLIEEALSFWRGMPPAPAYRRHPGRRRRDAAEFVADVIDAANGLQLR
jgi:Aminoglycoside adenylyltransferase, C-terminal domain